MSRTWLKRLLWTIAAILLLSLLAPWISADHYREPTRAALESALGRKVEISSVRFRILPQPGFTVSNVTIGEDPAIGAEPVAYVNTLRAIPRVTALLRGRLEFASVDLEEASLNLTRVDRAESGVHWNFSALARPQTLSAFPAVHIKQGRINFKVGDTKSVFYLLDTDLDLWPPASSSDPWTLRVHGEPARTDRSARGFGSFLVRGEWRPATGSLTLDARLEKSELSDILELFSGRQSVIQGTISGSAHLAGPVSHVGIAGRLAVANLHGWNQSPPGGNEWPLIVGGVVDASGQIIDLTARLATKDSPIELRYRASDYLKRPQWGVTAMLSHFALAPLAGIARNLGWAIPPDFGIDGTAAGAVSYSGPSDNGRMDGGLMLENCVLTVAGAPPLRAPGAYLRFSGSSVFLAPSPITNDRNETATLEGSWDSAAASSDRAFDATLSSDGMAIPSLSRQISVAGIPLLSQATAGTWKGRLHYSGDGHGGVGWQGELHLADTVLPFEAFAEPLNIVSADAAIDGAALNVRRISLSAGGIAAQGEYRYDPAAARPHRFRVTVPRADAAAIEKLLMPTLRRGNFFTYAFSFGRAPEPDWLRNMRADGNLQIGTLSVADAAFTQVQTHIVWDGSDVKLNDLKSRLGPATFAGMLTAHLNGRQPAYQAEGKLRGLEWRSGSLDADGSLVTSGTGMDLLSRLRAKGTFEGRNIELPPLETYDSLSGAFELAWDARGPRLRIPQLTAKSAAGTLLGSAEPGDNGQVSVKLSDESRHIQTSGEFVLRAAPEK